MKVHVNRRGKRVTLTMPREVLLLLAAALVPYARELRRRAEVGGDSAVNGQLILTAGKCETLSAVMMGPDCPPPGEWKRKPHVAPYRQRSIWAKNVGELQHQLAQNDYGIWFKRVVKTVRDNKISGWQQIAAPRSLAGYAETFAAFSLPTGK